MSNITFGTDGWRAIIAEDFNYQNISKIIIAIEKWLKHKSISKDITVAIGNDCRFMGKCFSSLIANILASKNIKVILASNDFISTPMISLISYIYKVNLGIIVTASHNPYYYNGLKLKSSYGGPLDEISIKEIEALIEDNYISTHTHTLDQEYINKGLITTLDFETLYIDNIKKKLNINMLNTYASSLCCDVMYGAGQNVIKDIFPNMKTLNAQVNPNFNYGSPEPIEKNLVQLQDILKSKAFKCGIAIDGDADRLALFDEKANYISSHKIIMLLIMYLYEYKGIKGDVISTFSCSDKITELCNIYGLQNTTTKIGFKYICKIINSQPDKYILGGEESGGIAIHNYIPERDGIFIALNILELMILSKLTLTQLITKLYDKVGYFATDRTDIPINKEEKTILEKHIVSFKNYFTKQVSSINNLDGTKFRFSDNSWVLLRLSGTEPILRIYCEAENENKVSSLIEETKQITKHICNSKLNILAK